MILKSIIIDDQQPAIDALKRRILTYASDDVQLIGEAKGMDEAKILFKEAKPDIVFLDIDLKTFTGFDFLEAIKGYDHKKFHIIFTTAFNQFAIKAIKYSAFDYLLKPIDPDELIDSINRLRVSLNTSEVFNSKNLDIITFNKGNEENKRIAISQHDKIHYLYTNEIIRCESDHNYTKIFTDNHEFLVSKTLKHYNELLEGALFCRIHQSHLVNLSYVHTYLKSGFLQLKNNHEVPVSTRKKEEVINLLANFK